LIETGPFFSGRISLERDSATTSGSDCSFEGDPASPATSVAFVIEHSDCAGVHLNGTAMTAFVVVQESTPIITHSSKKFLVVCHFKPATLTVTAG
jgi:hypothetical protein